jgi:hydrogenase expression/formation protein HypC
MCVGVPMQVQSVEPGFAWTSGRGERRRVSLALVGDCEPGQWLLVFLDSARERIDAERAREIDAALELLEAAMAGRAPSPDDAPSFALPSQLDAAALAALTGAVPAQAKERT